MKLDEGNNMINLLSRSLAVRSSSKFEFELKKSQVMDDVSVFTRSVSGATFYVSSKGKSVKGVHVVHRAEDVDNNKEDNDIMPSRIYIPVKLAGPGKFVVKVDSKSSALYTDNFLFVGKIKSIDAKFNI